MDASFPEQNEGLREEVLAPELIRPFGNALSQRIAPFLKEIDTSIGTDEKLSEGIGMFEKRLGLLTKAEKVILQTKFSPQNVLPDFVLVFSERVVDNPQIKPGKVEIGIMQAVKLIIGLRDSLGNPLSGAGMQAENSSDLTHQAKEAIMLSIEEIHKVLTNLSEIAGKGDMVIKTDSNGKSFIQGLKKSQ